MADRSPFHVQHFLQPPTTELSHFLVGDNQLTICNGCNPSYKKGILMKDLGYTKVGSTIQSGKPITGLFNFRQSSSTQKMLATVNDATGADMELYYSTGAGWTEIPAAQTAWTACEDALIEMESFIGYCFLVGYDSTDNIFVPPLSLTNTTISTTVNVTSMPYAKFIKRYRDRIYIANCYNSTAQPYRVYFSSVPSAGAITWTPASDFFDVDFSEEIMGIEQNWDRLVVFTEFSAYMYNQTEEKKMWDIGCSNNRTIQNLGSTMIWANRDNVWGSTGGFPQPLGTDIQELIRQSTPSGWRSAVCDHEYHIYLGATSANGLSYSNCLATLNVDSGMWRWRELSDSITEMAAYTTGNRTFLYLGASDGDVHVKGKYTDASLALSDNGDSIRSHFRTKAYDLGDPSIIKNVIKTVVYAEQATGLQLYYRLFNDKQENLQEFKKIGSLSKVVNIFNEGMNGHFIQFEGREMSKNAPWKFNGFTMLQSPDSKL